MALMITLTLPYPPTTNNLFVNAGKGRNKSPGYRKWLQEAGLEIMAQRPRLASRKVTGPYTFALVAERPDNRRRDLGNLEKPVSDLLVSMGLIGDDCDAEQIELRWSGIAPKKPGRVHVTVSPI
jgi:crossover junction endodeoxyribonuclease RusA